MFGLNALGAQNLYSNASSVNFSGIDSRNIGSHGASGVGTGTTSGPSTGSTKNVDPMTQFRQDVDLNGISEAYQSNLAYGRRGGALDVIA